MSVPRQVRLWRAWLEAQGRPKRKRGGQPGNLNALRHGGRSRWARARDGELSALLAEAKCAVRHAKRFVHQRKNRRPRALAQTNARVFPAPLLLLSAAGNARSGGNNPRASPSWRANRVAAIDLAWVAGRARRLPVY